MSAFHCLYNLGLNQGWFLKVRLLRCGIQMRGQLVSGDAFDPIPRTGSLDLKSSVSATYALFLQRPLFHVAYTQAPYIGKCMSRVSCAARHWVVWLVIGMDLGIVALETIAPGYLGRGISTLAQDMHRDHIKR